MFGRETPEGDVRVYVYGCGRPTAGYDIARQETDRQHKLQNTAIAILQDFQQKYYDLINSPMTREYDAMFKLLAEKKDILKKSKQTTVAALLSDDNLDLDGMRDDVLDRARGAVPLPPAPPVTAIVGKKKRKAVPFSAVIPNTNIALKREITELKKTVALLKPAIVAERARLKTENKELLDELNAARKKALFVAIKDANLFWGNRNRVMQSVIAAGKDAKFKAYGGKTTLSLQIQRHEKTGVCPATEDVFVDKRLLTYLQIEPVDPRAWDKSTPRGERRRLCRTKAKFFVRRSGGAPAYVEFPLTMHRALPANGRIIGAALVFERLGFKKGHFLKTNNPGHYAPSREEISLHITVRVPFAEPCDPSRPSIALRTGWALGEGNSQRVVQWKDSTGATGELVHPGDGNAEGFVKTRQQEGAPALPKSGMVTLLRQCEGLRSIQDQYKELALTALRDFKIANPDPPEWFKEVTKRMVVKAVSQKKKQAAAGRFLEVLIALEKQRLPGDETLFNALETFRGKYVHLYGCEFNLRDQTLRARKEAYRIFSSGINKKYGRITMLDLELAEMAKKDTRKSFAPQDNIKRMASISELKTAIQHTAQREGVTLVLVSATEFPGGVTLDKLLDYRVPEIEAEAGDLSKPVEAVDTMVYEEPSMAVT